MNTSEALNDGASMARPPSQVETELTKLANCLEELELVTKEIKERLNPVLIDLPLELSGEKDPPEDLLIPLASTIRHERHTIVALTVRQRETLSRIEL